ncbi:hypothetical protein K492DRAFT_203628 [Lichtheimia hyalospora FSU 10163]|nr:hypothetical protein K492DRAFT_203628 [Lichtheimia hyalospora FSU 10163]
MDYSKVQEMKTVGRRLSAISDRVGQGKQDPYALGDRILFCHDYINYSMVSECTEANLNETIQKLDRWQHELDANRGIQHTQDTD